MMSSPKKAALCVLCGRRPVDRAWRPFCSRRCKLQDLARWADGSYRVAGDRVEDPGPRRPDLAPPHGDN